MSFNPKHGVVGLRQTGRLLRTGPDISRADFSVRSSARSGGDEIAARLMELSANAQENGESYARLTAQNASAATSRQRGRAERVGMKLLSSAAIIKTRVWASFNQLAMRSPY